MEEIYQFDTSDKVYLTMCSGILIIILFMATLKKD
jgi:hypothetical protein